MKKYIIWISIIGILIFLIISTFRGHVNAVKDEKISYVKQLDFEFSGLLDSAERPGQVLFHITSGKFSRDTEREIGTKLIHNGVIELLLYRPDGKLDIMLNGSHDSRQGDSLYLNSNRNIVAIFRHGKLLSEHSLVKSLRGRPFRMPIIEGN